MSEATITGVIEIITYRNQENGFFVCKIKTEGNKKVVPVTGSTPINLSVGEIISVSGVWQNNTKYGVQLHAKEVNVMLPKSTLGIQKYLGSGVVKGVGPGFAKRIVDFFGENTIEVIEKTPEKLVLVKGVSEAKAQKISESWHANLKVREMMLFLQSHDVTVNLAMRIYKHYGDASINILREDPYRVARDIKGLGFLSADKIAMKLGMQQNDPRRVSAGVEHVLLNATSMGSCGLPFSITLDKAQDLLQVEKFLLERAVHSGLLSARLTAMLDERTKCIVIKIEKGADGKAIFYYEQPSGEKKLLDEEALLFINPIIFFTPLFNIEKNVANKLMTMLKTGKSILSSISADVLLERLSEQYNLILSDSQKDAIKLLTQSKVIVITGGPGTGKTTIISAILRSLQILRDEIGTMKVKLAAPTGRAAKRISESTRMTASTIHRMLEFDPVERGFKHNENNFLKCDLLILDEMSMVDIQLINATIKALPPTATLVLVGDVDQLPSIGPGQVLHDMIESGMVPTVRLDKVFRQAAHSKIITNAHMVNSGKIPFLNNSENSDFLFVDAENDLVAIEKLQNLISQEYCDTTKDVQVLSPMQRGSVGVKAINPMLQKILNKNVNDSNYVECYGIRYHIGDKVIQGENNYNKCVFNGDVGFIQSIDKEEQEVAVDFDGTVVLYDFDELDQISLAYAITIHKSQGSEYHTVIMPILTQHFIMLNKNLLYTGITRAKKKLIIIGQKKAVAMAVKSNRSEKRYSMLQSWLLKYR